MATFVRYNSGDIVLSTDKINSNAWTQNTNALTTNHTESTTNYSTPSSSGQFFVQIFQIT